MVYDRELRQKMNTKRELEKLWRAAVSGEDYSFSYSLKPPVALAKSAGRIHEVAEWAAFWKQAGAYWTLVTANKQAGVLGKQHDFPIKVEFHHAERALRYLGEWRRFQHLQERCGMLMADFPCLQSLCAVYREAILQEDKLAASIWQLAKYFSGTYRTDCYLRELDVPYVDTKFIEGHSKLVAEIFYALHPELEGRSFKDLCGALHWREKAPTPNIYLRSLDRNKTIGGLQELMVTAAQLAHLTVNFGRVFFTENKLNGYVFPEVEDGLIIFGAGNGVIAHEVEIPWLKCQQELWYWGDMDRDGLCILSRVREKYPQVRSFLMNQTLAEKYQHFMTADTGSSMEMPANLTCQEQACWAFLTSQPPQMNRLEQEKIPLSEVRSFLQELCGGEA